MATIQGCSVIACSCEHEYQDKAYGKGRRLHNAMQNGQWRCTVCSKVNGAASKTATVAPAPAGEKK
jgi:hypothetical protein